LSSNTKANPPPSADLEETAELPLLSATGASAIDPNSSTDAWISPAIHDDTADTSNLPTLGQQRSRGSRTDAEPLERSLREAEIGALRSDLASVSESRSHLERDLQSLSGNLRELEQMLNGKSEQLSVYEREVGLRDRRIAELEGQIAQLDATLAARQLKFDSELTAKQSHFDSELASVNTQRTGLSDQLVTVRADAEASRARIESQAAELLGLKAERSKILQRAQAAEFDLAQWRARGERYQETLQTLEGRRELYDGMIAEREARIASLEQEAAERERHVGAREEDLRVAVRNQEQRASELDTARTRADAAAKTARERIAALEAEVRQQEQKLREQRAKSGTREQEISTALKTQQQRNSELDASRTQLDAAAAKARTEADAAAVKARERIAALEAETRKQAESLRELSAKSATRETEMASALKSQQTRNSELDAARAQVDAAAAKARTEADVAAVKARERIAALEAETRTQAESLRELGAKSGTREEEMTAALGVQQRRNAELEATRVQADEAAAKARERIATLETETRQQAESLRQLRATSSSREEDLGTQLRTQQQRTAELEAARVTADAAAAKAHTEAEAAAATARERIAALETETRQQAGSLHELRVQFGAVRDSLAQRNAMIERVEAEAASSVAMLGNIQHNLEHLGAEEPAHLLVRSDGSTGILHLLGKRTTLGRTPDNDVHIDAEFISRHHAVALRAGAKTVIEDLNSTNGTYVNGQRINRRTLKDGDLVTLGKTEFRFTVQKPPPAP
jgi:chromosome segregation ATPase